MINFNWYSFSELTAEQLYAVLILRSDVFVVEQNCAYSDPDGKDIGALHLLGMEKGSLVAYLRLFPPVDTENHIIFGRVVTAKSARIKGYGKKLMQELLIYCDTHFPGIGIKCSAQNYLTRFYEKFGFKVYGKVYEEDGIPHIEMRNDSRHL
jgi:ElaA protein